MLRGESIRKSLDLTNWEAAARTVREWEIHGKGLSVSVEDACQKFLADCKSRNLSTAIIKKYGYVTKELTERFSSRSVRAVSTDDLRAMRNEWNYAPLTALKRLEYVRTIFSFCVSSGWLQANPAKAIKPPKARPKPTLPFSDQEWEKILWALDSYGEIHPQSPVAVRKQLRALVLVMRHSGIRISDAVALRRDAIDAEGRLFLYQAKTGSPVSIPLAPVVLEALGAADAGNPCYFWSNVGTVTTALTHWQGRLKKIFHIAGIPNAHSHRFRDTFSVDLLSKGVSLETVSQLLGHTSIKTTQKHYAPWVKTRQDALEAAVRATF